MEVPSLLNVSFPSLVADALSVAAVGVTLLAGLIFFNLGVLLPGLLSSLGWQQGDPRERYTEFGPVAVPLISEPAPPQQETPTTPPEPPTIVRPHVWNHLAGSVTFQLAAPSNGSG